ncbi:MAG TPA: hypothetical protein VNQ73_18715 [Ilumatobacter sp.]|nr:hypothetical protein [Ilumatobacter sp.]
MATRVGAGVSGVLAIVAIASIGLTACSLQRTEANEWGCTFGKGPFDSKALKGQYAAGSSGVRTNDTFVAGPADVRFYIIDEDPATADFGGRPIIVPARGSSSAGVGVVQVSVETQVRFVFNERFCAWYIDHGKRSEPLRFDGDPADGGGWAQFLNASMNQKLIEAARPVVAPEDYVSLYVNARIGEGDSAGLAYDVLASELSTNLSRELTKDLGGEYFCGPSYQFDGSIDGELANGCPPLEVTIKRIAPVDQTLISKLEQIVSNEEQQKIIASDKELELETIEAERQKELARIAANQETLIAQQQQRQAVETAQAEADLAIEQALAAVLEQQQQNAEIEAVSSTAFCRELAAVGVDCALLAAAENGNYPRIITSGDTSTSLLIDGGTGGG